MICKDVRSIQKMFYIQMSWGFIRLSKFSIVLPLPCCKDVADCSAKPITVMYTMASVSCYDIATRRPPGRHFKDVPLKSINIQKQNQTPQRTAHHPPQQTHAQTHGKLHIPWYVWTAHQRKHLKHCENIQEQALNKTAHHIESAILCPWHNTSLKSSSVHLNIITNIRRQEEEKHSSSERLTTQIDLEFCND